MVSAKALSAANPISQIKQIIDTQQSISTKKLEPMVMQLEKISIRQVQKINSQAKALDKLNTRLQQVKTLAEKRRHLVEENQDLRDKIHRQKQELARLTDSLTYRKNSR